MNSSQNHMYDYATNRESRYGPLTCIVQFLLIVSCQDIGLDCERRMAPQDRSFPFRWVLPSVQLFVCLALLWPVRGELFGKYSFFRPIPKSSVASGPKAGGEIAPTAPELERNAISVTQLWETEKLAPLVLDFPVLVVQLPYILVSPAKREWVPKGMFPDIWRAISWPFVGIFFWWLLGRGLEALSAARRSIASPRIRWGETTFAVILFAVGLVALAGIVTSTPEDRHDIQFMALVAGGVLWGILATPTIIARFLQWRIAKQGDAVRPGMAPSEIAKS